MIHPIQFHTHAFGIHPRIPISDIWIIGYLMIQYAMHEATLNHRPFSGWNPYYKQSLMEEFLNRYVHHHV